MPRPSVRVAPGLPRTDRSHDIMLDDGTERIGLKFYEGQPGFFQKVPVSESMRTWADEQREWNSGKGVKFFRDDPNGYFDGKNLWGMTAHKVFPTPQWFFHSNFRTADSAMPGSMNWQQLTGNYLYVSRTFVASASYSADKIYLWVRRVGTPKGNLTVEVRTDSSGSPSNSLVSGSQKALTTTDITDTVSELVVFNPSSTFSLTATTTYHLVVYGNTSDDDKNHWEVGVDASGTSSKYSPDGDGSPAWATAAFSLYYRITNADVAKRLWFFNLDGALYVISRNDDTTVNSQLWINGDRGTLSGATAVGNTTLTDSAKTWVVDSWIGAKVKIIDGAGEGQVFTITDNDATTLTVATGPVVALGTNSRFVIFNTPRWTEITGHGLTNVTGRPATAEKTAWIPQGTNTAVRRMAVNANSYNFNAEGTTVKYDFIIAFHSGTDGLRLWLAKAVDSAIAKVSPQQDTLLGTLVSAKTKVGSGDFKITGMFNSGEKMWVGKEDGLFYNEGGTINEVAAGIKSVPDPTNCAAMTFLGSTVFYSWGHSFAYMIGTETKDILNFRNQFDGLPQNRKGYVSAALTVLNWVIVAIDGGADNYSSVMVWNGIGWTEMWRSWTTGVRVRDIWYETNVDTRGRLWIDAGGEPVYIDFPLYASNPRNDSGLTYQHEAVMTTGTFTVDMEHMYKLLHEIRITSENLTVTSATNRKWVEIDYQTENDVETNNWTLLTTVTKSPFEVVPMDFGEVLRVRFRFRMLSTVAATPAVITSMEVNGKITDKPKYQFVGTFTLGSPLTYDNQDDFEASYLIDWIERAHTKNKKIQMMTTFNENHKDGKPLNVVVSLPMPSYDSVKEGEWKGRLGLAMQET